MCSLVSGCSYIQHTFKQAGYASQFKQDQRRSIQKHLLTSETFFVYGKLIEKKKRYEGYPLAIAALAGSGNASEIVDITHMVRVDSFYGLNLPPGAYQIVLLAGLLETDGTNFYNTYVCVNRGGLVAKFRKLHPFINKYLSPGSEYSVFELTGNKCGILICYDNNVIENVRATTLLGAEIIFMPHVTGCTPSAMPGRDYVDPLLWENRLKDPDTLRKEFDSRKYREWLLRWLPARAYDNGVYIVFSNPIGMDWIGVVQIDHPTPEYCDTHSCMDGYRSSITSIQEDSRGNLYVVGWSSPKFSELSYFWELGIDSIFTTPTLATIPTGTTWSEVLESVVSRSADRMTGGDLALPISATILDPVHGEPVLMSAASSRQQNDAGHFNVTIRASYRDGCKILLLAPVHARDNMVIFVIFRRCLWRVHAG